MKNKEEILAKVRKSAKYMRFLFSLSVISLVFLIGVFAWSIFTAGRYGFLEELITTLWGKITQDYQNMDFITKLLYLNLPDAVFKGLFLTIGMIEVILVLIINTRIYKIFRKMGTADSPFDYSNIKSLKTIAIVEIVMSSLSNPIRGISMGTLTWCLYKLYEYGCLLQEESDDTV